MRRLKNRHAFSLVELSIVLVILGLLVGGVLTGQSLIRAAELRAVSTEYSRYLTAVQTFRDKYFAIPGDMNNATQFWQRMTATADCVTNSSAATNSAGVCDGNGTGVIDSAGAASQSGEIFQFWRELALAGLVEGSYSGQAGSGGTLHMTTSNVPKSKLSNGLWGVRFVVVGVFAGSAGDLFAANYGNMMQFGAAVTNAENATSILKPEEAWNIDTKLDDGRPATGRVMVRNYGTCTNASGVSDTASTYLLTSSSVACTMLFINAF